MKAIGTLAQICRTMTSALGRELAAWKPSGDRARFGTEAMLSVALSVALAHALHLSNTWWAAISGFAVMQTSFSGSVQRAIHRILGTVTGAALGAIIGPLIGDRPWLFVPAMALIGGVAVYRANGSSASYAWVLGGITALMVTYEAHGLVSAGSIASFAALRVAEVAVGTLACVVVAGAFHIGSTWYRKRRPASVPDVPVAGAEGASAPTPASSSPFEALRPMRALLGMQAALAVAILAALTYVLHLPGFAQSVAAADARGRGAVHTRVIHRRMDRMSCADRKGRRELRWAAVHDRLHHGVRAGSSVVGGSGARADAAVRYPDRHRRAGRRDTRDQQTACRAIAGSPR